MSNIKTIKDNLYQIASKYNLPNEDVHIRSLSQHIIYYLKNFNDIEVLERCMRLFEYIRYNIETDYVNPGYSLGDTHNAVIVLQTLSKNTITAAWVAYLEKCVKYTFVMFEEYLNANLMNRTMKHLNNVTDDSRGRRIIFDSDDLKYKTAVEADEEMECDCDSCCDYCNTSGDGDSYCDSDSDSDSSDDGEDILNTAFIQLAPSPPPTYEEDKDWMEAFYKYKKYNKLYKYMHDHIDSIAYDHDSRLKYTTLLMSINPSIYNFASFLPENSPYYRSLSF